MNKRKDIGGARRLLVSIDDSAPTIMAGGIGSVNTSQYHLDAKQTNKQTNMNKPPYRVPLMSEINSITQNGFNVISTFSGCGGSCLGFKMAGFNVLYANEFIPAAQETYRANHPHTFLDVRDIRQVQPDDILKAAKLKKGQVDVFEGSPPCASFSTAGKREAGWGKVKKYSDTKQRVDDLFFEYTRLLRGLQPKVFVAENVSGLVKGTAKGYFLEILAALKDCGYNVKAKLLDAQWLGVPQMRQRIIFVGVRNDLGLEPAFPKPLTYQYSVKDALPWAVGVRIGKGFGEEEIIDAEKSSAQTIGTQPSSGNNINNGAATIIAVIQKQGAPAIGRKRINLAAASPRYLATQHNQFDILEKETDISRYAIGAEWDKIGNGGKSKKYLQLTRPKLDGQSGTITAEGGNTSKASVAHPTEKRKFTIAELKRIGGFPDDFILTGTYAQQWERIGRAVPPVMMSYIAATVRDEILCKLK